MDSSEDVWAQDAFWAGVGAARGRHRGNEINVRAAVPLLARMQRRYGGLFLEDQGARLRFRGDACAVVLERWAAAIGGPRVPGPGCDPAAAALWARGVLTARAGLERDRMARPDVDEAMAAIPGDDLTAVPLPPDDAEKPDNARAKGVMLEAVNARRRAQGQAARRAPTSMSTDAAAVIAQQVARAPYADVAARHGVSVAQVQRVAQRAGVRKRSRGDVDEATYDRIADMYWDGMTPRAIYAALRVTEGGVVRFPVSERLVKTICKTVEAGVAELPSDVPAQSQLAAQSQAQELAETGGPAGGGG
jgi:hypothetical protein